VIVKKIPAIKIASFILALAIVGCVSYYIYTFVILVLRAEVMVISSDKDFIKYELPDSGTLEDPYRIENKKLGVNSELVRKWYDDALDIFDTTKHFVVSNCTFYGGFSSIRLTNVADNTAVIQDNQIFTIPQREWFFLKSSSGISIFNTSGFVFSNNKINDAIKTSEGAYGMYMIKCSHSLITNNRMFNMTVQAFMQKIQKISQFLETFFQM